MDDQVANRESGGVSRFRLSLRLMLLLIALAAVCFAIVGAIYRHDLSRMRRASDAMRQQQRAMHAAQEK